MQFSVITLFPEMLTALSVGITGKALEKNHIAITAVNPRDFCEDKHKCVDDSPYGGGPGMVMMAKPLGKAIEHAKSTNNVKVIYLSPQGKTFNQAAAKTLAKEPGLIMVSGRYEGIDQRVIDEHVDEEWSIGDYVLSGGELPAMVMIDSIARCLPGVVGDQQSVSEDTFYNGLLKYPQYTRPESIAGMETPKVLLSGNHEAIRLWRLKQSLGITWQKRPDLLEKVTLTAQEQTLLEEFKTEN
jgi:tRNA (guanine37-N1)-methyltransferase